MNFISEAELKKAREDDSGKPESSESVDNRPLYERLKEMRDKKQLEYEETHALKNQFRGIDEDEADFLVRMDRAKEEQEARKRMEEEELVKLTKQTAAATHPELPLLLDKPQKAVKNPVANKQASLLSSLVRKRKYEDEQSQSSSSAKTADKASTNDSPAKQEYKEREPNCKVIGVLPGIPSYSDSSDEAESSSNSESLESVLPCVAIYSGKGAQKRNE